MAAELDGARAKLAWGRKHAAHVFAWAESLYAEKPNSPIHTRGRLSLKQDSFGIVVESVDDPPNEFSLRPATHCTTSVRRSIASLTSSPGEDGVVKPK